MSRIPPPDHQWLTMGVIFMVIALVVAFWVTCAGGCSSAARVTTVRHDVLQLEGSGGAVETVDAVEVHVVGVTPTATISLIFDDAGADWCILQPLIKPQCDRIDGDVGNAREARGDGEHPDSNGDR